MKTLRLFAGLAALAMLVLTADPIDAQAPPTTTTASGPKPITLADALAWKNFRGAALSPDGQWFAYQVAPAEGDGELIVRNIKKNDEKRFAIGESRGAGGLPPGLGGGAVTFSDDSKWLTFTVAPSSVQNKALSAIQSKTGVTNVRRPESKLVLLEVATGAKQEFEKVRRATFSPEGAGWIALHREPAEAGPSLPASLASALAGSAERANGTDLILRELATGQELNIGNVAEFAFDKKGQWLALAIDATGQAGNGVQLRHMANATQTTLDSGKASYRSLSWTENGEALTVLKGVEDKAYEGKLYSVLGVTDLAKKPLKKVVYDPTSDPNFPSGMTVSPNRSPAWTDDLEALVFGIHEVKKKIARPTESRPTPDKAKTPAKTIAGSAPNGNGFDYQPPRQPTPPGTTPSGSGSDRDKVDLVLWHWQDARLQSQQQVQATTDKNFSYLCVYRIKGGKFVRLADDHLRTVGLAPKQRWAVGSNAKPYELASSLDGRRYLDLCVIDPQTGQRRTVLKKHRWGFTPSPDGASAVYYNDGQYYGCDLATGKSTCLTIDAPSKFVDDEDDHNVSQPPTPFLSWTSDSKSVLISDGWDIWQFPIAGGAPTNLTVNGKSDGLRYRRRFALDPEEKGIDLSKPVYLSVYGEWTKKSGIGVVEGGKPGVQRLLWEDANFSTLLKARKADVYVYSRDTAKEAPEFFVTDRALANGKKLTDLGAQQAKFAWSSGSRLIEYTGVNGKRLQGALFLPADYEPGKRYPTIVYIYEKLSQGLNGYQAPTASGFSKAICTSNGYAVLMPDIAYKINDPGKSAVACILPALEAAIATGVVDRDRVGLHGHSWGGYQTAFLITQTDAFKAAIAGAPLTNLISMYSSIYWNTGSTNQPIFESSQGRFTAGYWDEPEAYTRNSPVYFAKNVKTPLLLLHNDKDGAVDWNQGIEYYNTLRRLGKPVVMLQYKGENHGLAKPANQRDYARRMREFFDHHLMEKPAPAWWTTGVPHLKIDEHLKAIAAEK